MCVFQLFFRYCGALLIPEKICCSWDSKVFCYLYSGYFYYFLLLLLFLFESDVFNSAARNVYLGNKKGQQCRVEWVFYFRPMRSADAQVLDICHCTPKSKPTVRGNMFWDISWHLCKYVFFPRVHGGFWPGFHTGLDALALATASYPQVFDLPVVGMHSDLSRRSNECNCPVFIITKISSSVNIYHHFEGFVKQSTDLSLCC